MGDCYGAGGWGRDSGVVACRRDVEIWLLGKGGECAGSFFFVQGFVFAGRWAIGRVILQGRLRIAGYTESE